MHSHTSETTCCGKLCWLDDHGQRREQSWVSRPQIQRVRPRKQTLRRVINTAESSDSEKGHSIQRALPPDSELVLSHTHGHAHAHTHTHCQDGFRDCFLWSLYGFIFTTLCLIMQVCNILTSPYLINNEWWGETLTCMQTHNSKYCMYPPPGPQHENTHFWVIRPLTHVWINSAACQIHTVALWPGTTHSATCINYLQERIRSSAPSKLLKKVTYEWKWKQTHHRKSIHYLGVLTGGTDVDKADNNYWILKLLFHFRKLGPNGQFLSKQQSDFKRRWISSVRRRALTVPWHFNNCLFLLQHVDKFHLNRLYSLHLWALGVSVNLTSKVGKWVSPYSPVLKDKVRH